MSEVELHMSCATCSRVGVDWRGRANCLYLALSRTLHGLSVVSVSMSVCVTFTAATLLCVTVIAIASRVLVTAAVAARIRIAIVATVCSMTAAAFARSRPTTAATTAMVIGHRSLVESRTVAARRRRCCAAAAVATLIAISISRRVKVFASTATSARPTVSWSAVGVMVLRVLVGAHMQRDVVLARIVGQALFNLLLYGHGNARK